MHSIAFLEMYSFNLLEITTELISNDMVDWMIEVKEQITFGFMFIRIKTRWCDSFTFQGSKAPDSDVLCQMCHCNLTYVKPTFWQAFSVMDYTDTKLYNTIVIVLSELFLKENWLPWQITMLFLSTLHIEFCVHGKVNVVDVSFSLFLYRFRVMGNRMQH